MPFLPHQSPTKLSDKTKSILFENRKFRVRAGRQKDRLWPNRGSGSVPVRDGPRTTDPALLSPGPRSYRSQTQPPVSGPYGIWSKEEREFKTNVKVKNINAQACVGSLLALEQDTCEKGLFETNVDWGVGRFWLDPEDRHADEDRDGVGEMVSVWREVCVRGDGLWSWIPRVGVHARPLDNVGSLRDSPSILFPTGRYKRRRVHNSTTDSGESVKELVVRVDADESGDEPTEASDGGGGTYERDWE
ncbi:hypothetical protein SISNIDRAFT_466518 [Sistotremastrum niveocremeum HHB9708]|uniref:Uncharacterized protein n=1 Tax=Sistotremastrum niveocremeum HHB9708 TaxID=1314777 RepID=A0A164UGR0_9AGAM|nr:hypothetical protein SISNIDRAFT_466518 [Sistotremastrum niveocremeum HHB9708]